MLNPPWFKSSHITLDNSGHKSVCVISTLLNKPSRAFTWQIWQSQEVNKELAIFAKLHTQLGKNVSQEMVSN